MSEVAVPCRGPDEEVYADERRHERRGRHARRSSVVPICTMIPASMTATRSARPTTSLEVVRDQDRREAQIGELRRQLARTRCAFVTASRPQRFIKEQDRGDGGHGAGEATRCRSPPDTRQG